MSQIEWTDETWNPVTGCDEVSPGCAHCYAKAFAERWRGIPGHPYEQGFDLRLWPERLEKPLRWRKPRMVFVNSMSDLFHEGIPWKYVARVFAVMAKAEAHTFQVLTKRPERMQTMLSASEFWDAVEANLGVPLGAWVIGYLPNVWLGVSIENRRFVHRADLLRQTPAAIRFISAEPLLGPLVPFRSSGPDEGDYGYAWHARRGGLEILDDPGLDLTGIDQLIVGAESGPKRRHFDLQWARDLRDACLSRYAPCANCEAWPTPRDARLECCLVCGDYRPVVGVHGHMRGRPAYFYKQGSAHKPGQHRELDGRTWDEFPIREEVAA